jgi:hypothetical protein
MKSLALLLASAGLAMTAPQQFDVVVYGGTAGGVITAITAAREGLKTALLEPGVHVGGMVSGGLGWTDYGKKEVIGGYALEFYFRVGRHYEMARYGQDLSWLHEPHVAEEIFRHLLKEAGVTLLEKHRLREQDGVRKQGVSVREIVMENGASFTAKVFVDSSYEGDLMAQSGITYTWGRESVSEYGESLAGVREKTPYHQFLVNVSPKDATGKLLPEISNDNSGAPGSADKKVQAYNYRMCFTDVPSNRVAFAKPANYNADRYTLLARLIEARTKAEGRVPRLQTFLTTDRLPNGKTDVNNNGAFSTDYIGGSWEYPTANYAKRAKIWQEHKDYMAGLFYFLANDSQVPAELRTQMNQWGLCKDEFADTENWPHQLYIRESRRMVGEYVMVQKDLQTELTKPDVIGMGSYNSDSHNVDRIVGEDGFVRNEGDMQVAVKPYQIPYRIMTPKRAQAANLLVPVAFSASHVAYSSVRMEPQYMILGQAAGVAAKLAIDSAKPVQDIDVKTLQSKLSTQGAVFEYVPSPQDPALRRFRSTIRR